MAWTLCTRDDPGGRKENEEFRERMEEQIHKDGFVIRHRLSNLSIDAFIEAEEDARENFVKHYGWLSSPTVYPRGNCGPARGANRRRVPGGCGAK